MTTYSTNTAVRATLGNPVTQKLGQIKQRVLAQTRTSEFKILAVILTALLLWAAAIATFGYPALILVALALVPTAFFLLFMITVGK